MSRHPIAVVLFLFATPFAQAGERNPFLKPLPALPAPSAVGLPALPMLAQPAAPLADEKIWDTVDLVAVSRSLILMRPQSAGNALAVHPGQAFRFAGEWWMALLEVDSSVKIHRGREGKGSAVASLWLNSPAPRVIGVGTGIPGAPGQAGAQPGVAQAAATLPVGAGR